MAPEDPAELDPEVLADPVDDTPDSADSEQADGSSTALVRSSPGGLAPFDPFRRYIAEMMGMRSDAAGMASVTDNYRNLLNQRLFWMPSAEPLGWNAWRDAARELDWLSAQFQSFSPLTRVQERFLAAPLTTSALIVSMAGQPE